VNDITELSAHDLSVAIRTRQVSCREVMQATLARIERVNPAYNAIVSLRDTDSLISEADERDAQLINGTRDAGQFGWMHGMPQAIKDTALTAGLRTTLGSPLLRENVPVEDGLMVRRMKAAGCIVIGKTNVPEFALGSHTFNGVFGTTRNAFDPARSAGGSSGGAAVALATHMLPVADGSDFMGSLRNPAAWANVFGLRPSQGRVPAWPVPDAWISQLSTEGPMARNVRDLAMLLQVQSGHDPRAPLSLQGDELFAHALDDFDGDKVRVGWLGDLRGHLAVEPGILDVCEQALRRLEANGCTVEPVAQPGFSPDEVWQAWLAWRRLIVAGRIAPFLVNPANRAHIKPEALWEYDQAQSLTGAQIMAASVQRTAFYHRMLALFERFDVLALPATQVWPFDAATRWPSHIAGREMDTYHRWMECTLYATFAGLPGISVPAGFGLTGLPTGLQLIGPPRGDRALLRLAFAYEQAAQDVVNTRPTLELA
jgi:amidase